MSSCVLLFNIDELKLLCGQRFLYIFLPCLQFFLQVVLFVFSSACDYLFAPFHLFTVQCLKCKNNSNTFDPLMDIMLDIKVTLKKLDKVLDTSFCPIHMHVVISFCFTIV